MVNKALVKLSIMVSLFLYGAMSAFSYTEVYQQGGGNDTMSEAENIGSVGSSTVTLNGVINIRFSSSDVDWYSFIPTGNTLSWKVSFPDAATTGFTSVALADADGDIVDVFTFVSTWQQVLQGSDSCTGTTSVTPGAVYYLICGINGEDNWTARPYVITLSTNGSTPTSSLSISPSSYSFDSYSSSGNISVTCNSSWSVSKSGSWITLNTLSGSNNGIVYYSISENTSSSSRSGTITVTAGSISRTCTITQSGKTVQTSLSISPSSDSFDSYSGSGSISVTCNSSWSVIKSGSWITLNTQSGSNNGTVYYSVSANTSSSSRSGSITITSGSISRTCTITQSGITAPTYTVYFNANGGTVSPTSQSVSEGESIGYLPTPTLEGYDFIGWFTSSSGGTQIYSSTTIYGNTTYYAHWTKRVTYYTVYFDANGGYVSQYSQSVAEGASVGYLPTPTHSDCSFLGWFTSPYGGNRVYSTTIVSGDVTYYAHWSQLDPTFDVSADGTLTSVDLNGHTHITIPDGVTRIGDSVFRWTNLESVTMPEGLVHIGKSAFDNCSSLESVIIPDGVMTIGDDAFRDCYNLRSVTIPDSVIRIGKDAFFNCVVRDTTEIRGVAMVDGWIVGSMPSQLPAQLDLLDIRGIADESFAECARLTSVTISGDFVSIGKYAFDRCTKLTSVTLCEGVEALDERAFFWCTSLVSITMPASITDIGAAAFEGCKNLMCVVFNGDAPNGWYGRIGNQTGYLDFYGVPDGCSAYVNEGSEGWGVEEGELWHGLVLRYRSQQVNLASGEKISVPVGLVGYTANGLPSGLTYNAKTGIVSGACKKPGVYEVMFSKTSVATEMLTFNVREEDITISCPSLSEVTFIAGISGDPNGIPVDVSTDSGVKSVAVSKLPAGMKYDAKTGLITGAPTKPGTYPISVTVTTNGGNKKTETIDVTVHALPESATGTFNGFVSDGADNVGTFQLTATDAGKLTAKVTTAAGAYSFVGANWDSVQAGTYSAALSSKNGDTIVLSLDATAGWNAIQLTGSFAAYGTAALDLSARRNAFGSSWNFLAEPVGDGEWSLTYAADAKTANLKVTLKADGTVTLAGSLDGTSVSASGYADVTGIAAGVIYADFAPLVSVKANGKTEKRVISVRTRLWFDRSDAHPGAAGSAKLVE